MHVIRLDHATINTADLRASLVFYEHFLGFKPGWRPPFDISGAWLYPEGGDYPILHLIERDKVTPKGGMFDHVAFRGKGLREYLAKVKAAGGWYLADSVPDTPLVQVQHFDPNQFLIEVNFENERLEASDVAS
jgi:catechol 2,3-dioxygenase-like lactoylglutathione lyase family enzyme